DPDEHAIDCKKARADLLFGFLGIKHRLRNKAEGVESGENQMEAGRARRRRLGIGLTAPNKCDAPGRLTMLHRSPLDDRSSTGMWHRRFKTELSRPTLFAPSTLRRWWRAGRHPGTMREAEGTAG